MGATHKVIFQTLKADLGFLLCLDKLKYFYQQLGWEEITERVIVANKGEFVEWTEVAMLQSNGDFSLDVKDCFHVSLNGKAF